ncbi:MAG: rhomboid family intramembrane serine protease [Stomatobaculum sp.]|nr:rhomboid family intramembrane serine protease [Stomatobaculum sp.]
MNKKQWNITYIIMAVNIVLFLLTESTGGSENVQNMIRWGAVYGPRIIKYREYWRFLTAAFLHFGIAHIANNMLILFALGPHLENALGRVRFLLFYLVSAAAANVSAFLIELPAMDVRVSAGASGAIFSVSGGLLWAALRNGGRIGSLTIRQILVFACLSMAYGLTGTDVDNIVHAAGFVSGFLFSVVLYRKTVQKY